jgi:hypothetical protein
MSFYFVQTRPLPNIPHSLEKELFGNVQPPDGKCCHFACFGGSGKPDDNLPVFQSREFAVAHLNFFMTKFRKLGLVQYHKCNKDITIMAEALIDSIYAIKALEPRTRPARGNVHTCTMSIYAQQCSASLAMLHSIAVISGGDFRWQRTAAPLLTAGG